MENNTTVLHWKRFQGKGPYANIMCSLLPNIIGDLLSIKVHHNIEIYQIF
jgi:hypothetical protein